MSHARKPCLHNVFLSNGPDVITLNYRLEDEYYTIYGGTDIKGNKAYFVELNKNRRGGNYNFSEFKLAEFNAFKKKKSNAKWHIYINFICLDKNLPFIILPPYLTAHVVKQPPNVIIQGKYHAIEGEGGKAVEVLSRRLHNVWSNKISEVLENQETTVQNQNASIAITAPAATNTFLPSFEHVNTVNKEEENYVVLNLQPVKNEQPHEEISTPSHDSNAESDYHSSASDNEQAHEAVSTPSYDSNAESDYYSSASDNEESNDLLRIDTKQNSTEDMEIDNNEIPEFLLEQSNIANETQPSPLSRSDLKKSPTRNRCDVLFCSSYDEFTLYLNAHPQIGSYYVLIKDKYDWKLFDYTIDEKFKRPANIKAINGLSEILSNKEKDELTEEDKKLIHSILSDIYQNQQLIQISNHDNMLAATTIENTSLQPTAFVNYKRKHSEQEADKKGNECKRRKMNHSSVVNSNFSMHKSFTGNYRDHYENFEHYVTHNEVRSEAHQLGSWSQKARYYYDPLPAVKKYASIFLESFWGNEHCLQVVKNHHSKKIKKTATKGRSLHPNCLSFIHTETVINNEKKPICYLAISSWFVSDYIMSLLKECCIQINQQRQDIQFKVLTKDRNNHNFHNLYTNIFSQDAHKISACSEAVYVPAVLKLYAEKGNNFTVLGVLNTRVIPDEKYEMHGPGTFKASVRHRKNPNNLNISDRFIAPEIPCCSACKDKKGSVEHMLLMAWQFGQQQKQWQFGQQQKHKSADVRELALSPFTNSLY